MTPDAEVPEFAAFGAVQLQVVDLQRSSEWWREVVGLRPLDDRTGTVDLGVDTDALVVLREGATSRTRRGYAGLYHLALVLPDAAAFAHTVARILASGERFGATDHLVAQSIYLQDPDGIGVELALETPERVRVARWLDTEPEIIDTEGRRRSGAEPLDLDRVLAAEEFDDLSVLLARGTRVGHVHLQVADFAASYRFYRDELGFVQENYAPQVGFGDLGAGRPMTHRIAVNVWQGSGVPPRPPAMAGMEQFTLRFASADRLAGVLDRVDAEPRAGAHIVRDPDGNAISLTS